MATKAPKTVKPAPVPKQPAPPSVAPWLPFLIVVVILAAVGASIYMMMQDDDAPAGTNTLTINSAAANTFGDLSSATFARSTSATGEDTAVKESGATAPTTDAALIAVPDVGGTYYRYVYNGTALSLTGGQVNVLKREPGNTSPSSLLSGASFGLVDLESFGQTKVQSAVFTDEQPFGYTISVDYTQGTVNIGEYWQGWYTAAAAREKETTERSAYDVPADSELIAIANAFFADHGISTAAYEEPVVQENSGVAIPLRAEVSSSDVATSPLYYYGDTIAVVYPLSINGTTVVTQSGDAAGMWVNINIAEKKVASVTNLTTLTYTSSAYDAVTDEQKVLDAIAAYSYVPEEVPEGSTVVDIELGTPTTQYVQMYTYKEETGMSEEVLVPALVFPITPPDGATWYQKALVFPLAEDLLTSMYGGGSAKPITIDTAPSASDGGADVDVPEDNAASY